MWQINDNIISLHKDSGEVIYPSAGQVLSQKDSESFIIDGESFPPLKDLPIRISQIGISQIRISFEQHKNMAICVYVDKRGERYSVPFIEKEQRFADAIVINNVCYPIYGNLQDLNAILLKLKVIPIDVSYTQYMNVMRALSDLGLVAQEDEIQKKSQELQNTEIQNVTTEGLQAELFPYQKSGLNWLTFMVEHGCGCILGDEMGLGKTLQVIATVGHIKEVRGSVHCLVVCPVSLLENWKREIAKFYPSLNVRVNHGPHRCYYYQDLLPFDVVVVSYSSLQPDCTTLQMIDWDLVVIDEAQNVKNPRALRTQYLKRLNRKTSIAVSGTPFENHMTDVWSVVDFVLPGFLGTLREFENEYTDDVSSAQRLERLISPIMIRRRVKDVGKSLPERIDVPVPLVMTKEEAQFYENGRKSAEEDYGLTEMSLDKIQKLRMFCTHPSIYDPANENADPSSISNKYARFCEILEEIFVRREKVIVFTSFSNMIQLIVEDIRRRFGVYTNFIDGSVDSSKRQKIVDEFSAQSGAALLALNPIAAGTGLNITAANHVIHYNLEWNPSKEDQASARAYRTGQTKTVIVHRLFYIDTIEEIINEKIQRKRMVSEATIVGNIGDEESKEELIKALQKSPYRKERYE